MILSTQDIEKDNEKNISLTARRFGLTSYLVRIGQKKLDKLGPRGLND